MFVFLIYFFQIFQCWRSRIYWKLWLFKFPDFLLFPYFLYFFLWIHSYCKGICYLAFFCMLEYALRLWILINLFDLLFKQKAYHIDSPSFFKDNHEIRGNRVYLWCLRMIKLTIQTAESTASKLGDPGFYKV